MDQLRWTLAAQHLWDAADAVFRLTKATPKGKRAKKNHNQAKCKVQAEKSKWVRARQDELLAGDVDTVLQEVYQLTARVARTGPGTRSRRNAITSTATYLKNHREAR